MERGQRPITPVSATISKYGRAERNDTYSYMTMETASFNKLSPKMMVYSFGSTLYWLKMARMVTGSVADSVDPNVKHSIKESSSDSKPRNE